MEEGRERNLPTAFQVPQKRIVTEKDIETFKRSKAFKLYLQFIYDLQKSVESKGTTGPTVAPKFEKLIAFLDQLEEWVAEIPPLEQPMRFGNKAFRTWHERLQANVDRELQELLPREAHPAIEELRTYLLDSFGSYDRIDYGTGHELAFALFLLCLRELGLYGKEDYENLVRRVFFRYIALMRKIQLTYKLEPAGSHGVWGIDDYHFLPFLFGAAELVNNPVTSSPDDIHSESLTDKLSGEYMYFSCIKFIREVKKGVPFGESSPILNDISATPTWTKVAQGMIKMYQGEVLFKHPVIKHMYFGSLISFDEATA